MLGSLGLYAGVAITLGGLVLLIRPARFPRVPNRRRARLIAAGGAVAAAASLVMPAQESRAASRLTRLDEFLPVWQFREVHTRRVSAPPAAVYAALRRVRADDILLFRTLTWIRRGGRALPEGILNAGHERPIIDVALAGGFVLLADEANRELLLGAIVGTPDGEPRKASPELILHPPAGYSVAAMNFLVTSDGGTGSIVATETRVFSSDDGARRRFARYWRIIYPGSALIRRMWLRAIERATGRSTPLTPRC